jgi:hypothetical protein
MSARRDCVPTAEIVSEVGHERHLRGPFVGQSAPCCCTQLPAEKLAFAGLFPDGETQTRTGDTTIFSRVLYQLSYLA